MLQRKMWQTQVPMAVVGMLVAQQPNEGNGCLAECAAGWTCWNPTGIRVGSFFAPC